jgi:AraC-like DNA-binding protein
VTAGLLKESASFPERVVLFRSDRTRFLTGVIIFVPPAGPRCPRPGRFPAAVPPYQYEILRRVERAKQLLHAGTDLSLAEVTACAGFSDQSRFSRHFKRLVGVTPGQFRTPARIA